MVDVKKHIRDFAGYRIKDMRSLARLHDSTDEKTLKDLLTLSRNMALGACYAFKDVVELYDVIASIEKAYSENWQKIDRRFREDEER